MIDTLQSDSPRNIRLTATQITRPLHYLSIFILMAILSGCGGGNDGDDGGGSTNTNPTVNAGTDQLVLEGASVQLEGNGTDAEGPVSYAWAQDSGPSVTLSDGSVGNPTFTAPQVNNQQALQFTLTVTDSDNVTVSDTVEIVVADSSSNNPPVVNAGVDETVDEGTTVQLMGTGSDAEGAVSFSWTQLSGSSVTLSDASIADPTFTAPQVTGSEVLVFRLTVSDTGSLTTTDDVAITVTDAGGGGGGGSSSTYLFYSNPLTRVDPSNPLAPEIIEPTAELVTSSLGFGTSAELIWTGTYNGSTKMISDMYTHAVIYAKTDGHLYKVSGEKSSSKTPVQVSSESQADEICVGAANGSAHREDLATPGNSQYYYALPGNDGLCETSDDIWKMVRLIMSAGDAPILAKKPVDSINDVNTGALTGWLVHDAGNLSRCDEDFANCSIITPGVATANMLIASQFNHALLEIDGQLFIYDVAADSLSSPLFTIPTGTFIGGYVSDGNTVYFNHGSSVYQLPGDGSTVATLLVTEANNIQRVELTTNKVVYQLEGTDPGSSVEIKAVAKAGGTAISLATAPGVDDFLLMMFPVGDYVYYQVQNYSLVGGVLTITPVLAGVVDENGTNKTETADSAWTGGITKNNFDMNQGSSLGQIMDQVLIAEGYDITGTSGAFAGATVKVVDGATSTPGVTLGTLPTTDKILNFNCFGSFTNDGLCTALNEIVPTPAPPALPIQSDMFYFDPATANSLTRITNTPAESEVLIVF